MGAATAAAMALERVTAGYGKKPVIVEVSLQVGEGEIVTLIGPNGAGKSTTLRAAFGLLRPSAGRVLFRGREITGRPPAEHVRDGIAFVPQGARVFPDLSVDENIVMAGSVVAEVRETRQRAAAVYEFLPALAGRRAQRAGALSGGERQMLALGMAMMLRPSLLLLDEPSTGLAPHLVKKVMQNIREINREHRTSVLIVEQNARQVLDIASRVYVMKVGRVVSEETPERLAGREELRKVFLA